MASEKTGFIYIWRDRKHNRYYIGYHWGHEWDGYICSSRWMRKAYKRRPQDFKRRILKRGISFKDLPAEEFKWLSLIKDEELGTRYYNVNRYHFGHWSNTSFREEVAKKCANKQPPKTKLLTDEEKIDHGRKISEAKNKRKLEKISQGLPIRDPNAIPPPKGRKQSEEEKTKRSEAMKKAWKEGRNKGTTGHTYEWSEERRQNHKQGVQGCHENRNPEAYSTSGKKAWAEGKYANRKSNNMRDFIWVTFKENGTRTRIRNDRFDPTIHIKGRKPIEPKYL